MARDHTQTRMYPMDFNYIGDCVFSLTMAGVGYNVWNSGAIGNGFEIDINHTCSMSSYGEEIRVTFWPVGNQVQVTIYSKNAWPLQLVDMGRNEKNALEIFDAIETGRYLNHPVFLQMKQQRQGMPPQGQPQGMPQQQWQNMPPQGQQQGMPQQQWQNIPSQGPQAMPPR